MSNIINLIQNAIFVLDTDMPEPYKKTVYDYITKYEDKSYNWLSVNFKISLQAAEQLGVPYDPKMARQFYLENNTEKLSLLARLHAISLAIALNSTEFKRPFSWWHNQTSQLIDLNEVTSNTIN